MYVKKVFKKLKPHKFFMGKPSQNYGVSPKYGVTQFYLHLNIKERAHIALTPAGECWYSIYLPQRDGKLS